MNTQMIKTVMLVLSLLFLVGAGFKGCQYLNLSVSEKYETQLEGISNSEKELEQAKVKAIEIKNDKKYAILFGVIFLVLFALALVTYLRLN